MSRFLTKIFFKFFSQFDDVNNGKYDMCLSISAKVISILSVVFGVILIIVCITQWGTDGGNIAAILGTAFLGLGSILLFVSFNKWIRILSDDEFEFSNAFGKKTIYRFDDIQLISIIDRPNDMGLRQQKITLVFPNKRINIEEECVLSDRFVDKLNKIKERL